MASIFGEEESEAADGESDLVGSKRLYAHPGSGDMSSSKRQKL
jgi:hypothetical protein